MIFIGFIIIAVSNMATNTWGFYTALIGSSLCGSMSSLGESVVIGFLKVFPSNSISGWGSGTGMAGIFGNLLFIVLQELDVNLSIVIKLNNLKDFPYIDSYAFHIFNLFFMAR